MRADQDVDLALLGTFEDILFLFRGPEARKHFDHHGELAEAPLEALEVLEAEHRSRCQHGDLLAILHRLEGRAHGNFGLAVTNVTAEQTVHRLRRFHVGFDIRNRRQLVVGLVEVEGVFELALHVVIRREGRAHCSFALRIELQKLFGHVLHGLLHTRFGLGPGRIAEPVQLRRGPSFGRSILLDQVQSR